MFVANYPAGHHFKHLFAMRSRSAGRNKIFMLANAIARLKITAAEITKVKVDSASFGAITCLMNCMNINNKGAINRIFVKNMIFRLARKEGIAIVKKIRQLKLNIAISKTLTESTIEFDITRNELMNKPLLFALYSVMHHTVANVIPSAK